MVEAGSGCFVVTAITYRKVARTKKLSSAERYISKLVFLRSPGYLKVPPKVLLQRCHVQHQFLASYLVSDKNRLLHSDVQYHVDVNGALVQP